MLVIFFTCVDINSISPRAEITHIMQANVFSTIDQSQNLQGELMWFEQKINGFGNCCFLGLSGFSQ